MTLFDLVLLMVIGAIAAQFWRLRGMTERASAYLTQYCEKQQLQLISVARNSTRLRMYRGKPDWQCEFIFEFSGNGEDSYKGQLFMAGMNIVDLRTPAYRVH